MSPVRARRLAAGFVAGALVAGLAVPAGAQEERNPFAGLVQAIVGQLERVATDRRPPPERPPATLRPCTELYHQDILEVARGPELAATYNDWLLGSYEVMREVNGELLFPICFRWRVDVVDTNLSRYLLNANAKFIRDRYQRPPGSQVERRFHPGYVLIGYLDPTETDTALARRRADLLQPRLPGPPCRYEARGDPRERGGSFQRKVHFTFRPAVPTCPRTPG